MKELFFCMEGTLVKFLERLSGLIWGPGLVVLLLGAGLVYTFRLGAPQLRMFPELVRNVRKSKSSGRGMSQFRTVCMSLGTAMGTGNITGVASALALGGPGAVFWMWVSAFFGMALVCAENALSSRYSSDDAKGPMAYISKGLGCRRLSLLYAAMCLGASMGMGGMVQVSSAAAPLCRVSGIGRYAAAAAAFVLIYIVVSGGARRIGRTAQSLLPLATVLYAGVCAAVLIKMHENILPSFGRIFSGALGLRSAAAGTFGCAVSAGIKRGIFSNEAGLGSSPLLHSAAEDQSQGTQSCWAMFEVFIDTVLCCTLTALTILCASPDLSAERALSAVLGRNTAAFLAGELCLFAFCTIIGWYFCGETALRYLTGNDTVKAFPFIFAAAASLGAVFRVDTVWLLSDIFNGAMALPNLAAVILLIKTVPERE